MEVECHLTIEQHLVLAMNSPPEHVQLAKEQVVSHWQSRQWRSLALEQES
jgi:hypothetical protein